ncbi:MAG: hypothetical protein B5M56_07270 [Desulfococcus sp. 4484_241]|nr:MAG: hypothetical protein B5M56_07270 [Desulfococcus sp. 4484_241]
MKSLFGEKISLHIHDVDLSQARQYGFKGPIKILLDQEPVPLKTAFDREKMKRLILDKLTERE